MISAVTKRTVVAVMAGLLGFAATVAPAAATSSVVNVRLDPSPQGGATLTVVFGGPVPRYNVTGAGTTETAIVLQDTTLGASVAPTLAGAGPVTSITVLQGGNNTTSIALHLSAAAPVRVRGGGSTLFVDVSPGGATIVGPGGTTPFGAVPAAPAAGNVTEVVPLKYADISEVAGVLVQGANVASNDNFSPQYTSLGTSSLGGSFGGSFGGTFAAQQPAVQTFGANFGQTTGLAQRLNDNVAVDRRLNAIVLMGPPEVVAALKATIDKLDVPLDSVILETEIVELSITDARDIGIDFAAQGANIISSATDTSQTFQSGQGRVNFAANLTALVSSGRGKLLARPRILAQSGSNASILTGDAIPIITQVVVTGSSALTSQQVNYVNVGVNLQIQPRVTTDGFVTSHIFSEVSSVTGFVQGAPQISQRQANTVATVRDGESFVIGGLLQDNEIRTMSRVPFIGDLPIIGVFFRHYVSSHTQTNLYLVVTPHVVARAPRTVPPVAAPSPSPTPIPPMK